MIRIPRILRVEYVMLLDRFEVLIIIHEISPNQRVVDWIYINPVQLDKPHSGVVSMLIPINVFLYQVAHTSCVFSCFQSVKSF